MPKIKTKSGAKKRFKMTGTGKVLYRAVPQAPRHDQADQEADPPAARHQASCSRPTATTSRSTFCRTADGRNARSIQSAGDQPWLASSAASPHTPSTRKSSRPPRAIYGRRKNTIRVAKQAVEKAQPIRLPRPQAAQAHLPGALDPAPQRGGAPVRPDLQPVYRRPRQGRAHGRPQGAVRSRDPRAGGVPGDRREGQGRAAGLSLRLPAVLSEAEAGRRVKCPDGAAIARRKTG